MHTIDLHNRMLTQGGIIDENEEKIKAQYNQVINQLSRQY